MLALPLRQQLVCGASTCHVRNIRRIEALLMPSSTCDSDLGPGLKTQCRITCGGMQTLDLGLYLGYGIFVLVVEIVGATTVMLYGVNLLFNPVIEKFEEDPSAPGRPKVPRLWRFQ